MSGPASAGYPRPSAHSGALPAAVLWDMDGTLVDTEPYWMAEEIALVEAWGGTWTKRDAQAIVGNDLLIGAQYMIDHSPIRLRPVEVVQTILGGVIRRVRELGAPWRPGARELLDSLAAEAVPCAMVTMSWRSLTDALVEVLPPGTFAAIVTGDEVSRGKPHPDPYLAAAAALGVSPDSCVAIEDSPTGVASAVAAGVPTIAVPNVAPVPVTLGVVQIPSLAGVQARDLLALLDAAHRA